MKKTKLITMIPLAAFALQVLAEVLAAIFIFRLNMLPGGFVAVIVAVFLLMLAGTGLLLFLQGKKPVGFVRKIIACVLALVITFVCGAAVFFADGFYRTMHTVTEKVVTTARNVYVFVEKDDPAQTIQDAKGYRFGYIGHYDVKHTQQAIIQLEDAVGDRINVLEYSRSTELVIALFEGELDAVIMNGASVSLLMEDPNYADFTDKIRILETMSFSELEATEPTEPEQTQPDVQTNVTNTPFAVYISGSDTRSNMLTVSRSDVNILVIVNPQTKQILLLNTPRDYYVENPAGDGAMDKLTHCGLYGPECSMEVLGKLYGVDIDFYGQINFTGFEMLVDAVGGITVTSDQSFKAGDTYITAGENQLNGKQALDFARERYHVSGGDRGRGQNQMRVVKAVIEKMTTGTTVISNYTSILQSMEGMFVTSMGMDDISLLVKMQLSDMAKWNIQSYSVSGVGGSERTYSMPGDYAYVMYEDEAATAYAAKLIQRVYAGEILTQDDMKGPQQ